MSELIAQLFKSRNILLEQLDQQGYEIKDFTGCSKQEINILSDKNQMDMLIDKKNAKEKIYVKYYYNDGKQMTTKNLDAFVAELFSENEDEDDEDSNQPFLTKNDTLLIISSQELNDSLTRKLKELWEMNGYYVVIINLARLQYDCMNHTMQPNHRVVRDTNDIAEIKKKFSITDDRQFPTISRFGPAAVAIGLKPGELVAITRPSKTAITTMYYRICINI
jgi:DNA-directed RNA polymerase subunit H (RpoH/RPB5)